MIIRIYTRRTNLSNNWLRRTKHQIPLPDKQKHFQKMQGMHESKLQARHFLFKFNFPFCYTRIVSPMDFYEKMDFKSFELQSCGPNCEHVFVV